MPLKLKTYVLIILLFGIFFLGRAGRKLSIAPNMPPASSSSSALCTSEGCKALETSLRENIDTSIDPCEDFFGYVCNGWIQRNPIPDDRSTYGQFSDLSLRNKQHIRLLVDKLSPDSEKLAAARAAAKMRDACLNEAAIEKEGFPPDLKDAMNLVSFSGSDDVWTPVDASALAEILSALRLRGISTSPLLFFSVGTDDKNSSRRTVFSGQSGITLPDRDYYLGKTSNDAQLKAYRQYISNCFQLSGFAESESDGNSIASAIIAFETMIAEKMLPNDELRDPEKLYNPILIDDIASSSPNFAWKEYSQKLFEERG